MTGLGDFELRSTPGLFHYMAESGRNMGFKATSLDEVSLWQDELRGEVWRLLGLSAFPNDKCALKPEVIESREMPDFTCETVVIQTVEGEFMPCYVLTPPNAEKPYKPVIALHGHGTWGAKSLVGIADSPAEADYIRDYHADYAAQIARLGYQVFTPMLRGFGIRMEDRELQKIEAGSTDGSIWSCQELGLNALLCGQTLMGLRVWDIMRLIDYIYEFRDVELERLPCVGLSGGGTATMYVSALDQRITSAYISGAINLFRDSIMSIPHCVCNYVPHITQYAEMPDVAGLIAPRPLMVENGDGDPIYPAAGVEAAKAILRQVYETTGQPQNLSAHTFHGEHRWDGEPVGAWLAKQYP